MQSGASDAVIARMQEVFARHAEVKRVILFGSRSRGDNKYNSDIDIAVFADGGISGDLYADIDEAAGIYKVDIVDMAAAVNDKLLKHIILDGIEIYSYE